MAKRPAAPTNPVLSVTAHTRAFAQLNLEALILDAEPAGYAPRRIDAHLSQPEANALRRLFDGLEVRGERLANGRPIKSCVDALRWLLQQFPPPSAPSA